MAPTPAVQASHCVFAPPAWRAAGPRAKEFPVNSRPETKYLLPELLAGSGFEDQASPVGRVAAIGYGSRVDELPKTCGYPHREPLRQLFRVLGIGLLAWFLPRHSCLLSSGEKGRKTPLQSCANIVRTCGNSPGLKGVGANTTGSRGLCDRSNNAPVLSPPFMGAGGRCPLKGGAGCSTVEGSGPRSVPAWSGSQKRRRPRRMPVQRGPEVHPETPLRRIP
jgi:hypothetical protein